MVSHTRDAIGAMNARPIVGIAMVKIVRSSEMRNVPRHATTSVGFPASTLTAGANGAPGPSLTDPRTAAVHLPSGAEQAPTATSLPTSDLSRIALADPAQATAERPPLARRAPPPHRARHRNSSSTAWPRPGSPRSGVTSAPPSATSSPTQTPRPDPGRRVVGSPGRQKNAAPSILKPRHSPGGPRSRRCPLVGSDLDPCSRPHRRTGEVLRLHSPDLTAQPVGTSRQPRRKAADNQARFSSGDTDRHGP